MESSDLMIGGENCWGGRNNLRTRVSESAERPRYGGEKKQVGTGREEELDATLAKVDKSLIPRDAIRGKRRDAQRHRRVADGRGVQEQISIGQPRRSEKGYR